ncbi:MAG: flippase [Patescibacteria group bacterium]
MSFARAVFWNTAIQTAGRGVSTLLGLGVLAIMTRSLGPENFGAYSIAVSFLQFFAIIADFGLSLTANRMLGEVSGQSTTFSSEEREAQGRVMSNIFTLRLAVSVVFFAMAPLIAFVFFPYSLEVKQAIGIAIFSFFAIALTQTLVPLFQQCLRMEKVVMAELAGRMALLVGISIAAWLKLDFLWYIAVIVLGSLVNFIFLRAQTGAFTRIRFAYDAELWRRIIAMSWPIGISIIFNLIYLKADILFLSVLRPETEVGFYSAAYRVLDILTGMATMFMGLVLPAMTAAWVSGNRERFLRLLERSFDAMVLVALPTVAMGVILGRPMMEFVAGRDFSFSGDILGVLIFGMGAVFFSTLFGHTVVALGKQRSMIWGYALDAAFSLAAYAILIPRYGIWGAAWTTVFSEVLMVILTAIVVVRSSRAALKTKNCFRILLSAGLAAIGMLLLRDTHWLAALALGAALYGACLYVTGVLNRELLRDLLRLRRAS